MMMCPLLRWTKGWIAVTVAAVFAAAAGADLSEARAKLDEYDAARKALTEVVQKRYADPAQQQRDALRYEQKTQRTLREARQLYEDGGILASEDLEALRDYVRLLRDLGYHDLAAEALEHAVTLAPEDARLWALLGESLIELGPSRRKDALAVLRKPLAIDGTSPEAAKAHFLLGDLYRREGLYAFAKDHYTQAAALAPGDARTVIHLAAMKAREGDVIGSEADLAKLGRAAQPYDAETRTLLREALAGFDSRRRWFPDTAAHHRAYSRLLYRAARMTGTLLAARRAARLDPTDFETWNFMASVQLQLGNAQQTVEMFEQSLKAKADQPEVTKTIEGLKKQIEQQGKQGTG